MKTYSLDQLKTMAEEFFAGNTEATKFFATSDGQFFGEGKRNAAEFHSKQNKGLKIYDIEKPQAADKVIKLSSEGDPEAIKAAILAKAEKGEELTKAEFQELTIQEVKAYVALLEAVEAIEALGEHDTKGGKAAVQARIEELAADPTASTTNKKETE
jgi:hypothetical protein